MSVCLSRGLSECLLIMFIYKNCVAHKSYKIPMIFASLCKRQLLTLYTIFNTTTPYQCKSSKWAKVLLLLLFSLLSSTTCKWRHQNKQSDSNVKDSDLIVMSRQTILPSQYYRQLTLRINMSKLLLSVNEWISNVWFWIVYTQDTTNLYLLLLIWSAHNNNL